MNSKAAIVLLEALKYAGVELELYLERSHLEKGVNNHKVGATGPSRFLHIDAHLSGRKSDGENIGALLSQHGIYLQDPRQPLTSLLEYCNPHILPLDVSDVDVYFQELELHTNQTKGSTEWIAALDSLPQQQFDATAVSIDETIVVTSMMP